MARGHKLRIAGCYIVRNEAAVLAKSLDSLAGAVDELVVVDTGSEDDTAQIARSRGARVVSHEWREDFSEARNFALGELTADWVVFLDADEYFTPETRGRLRAEIEAARLPLEAAQELDLVPERSTLDLKRSILMHRLRAGGVVYGHSEERSTTRGAQALAQTWRVQWTAATEASIELASIRGLTVEQIASTALLTRRIEGAVDIVRLLRESSACACPAPLERALELATRMTASVSFAEAVSFTLALSDVALTCTQDAPVLYVTNTSSQATLTRCTLTAPGGLVKADEDRWGTSGSNGGALALTMDATTSDGAIAAGSSSSVTVTTANGGAATGTASGSVTVS